MTIRDKKISFQASNPVGKLIEVKQSCFSIDKAYRLLPNSITNAVKQLLSDMTKQSLLMRIKDRLYYVIPFEQGPETFMPERNNAANIDKRKST